MYVVRHFFYLAFEEDFNLAMRRWPWWIKGVEFQDK